MSGGAAPPNAFRGRRDGDPAWVLAHRGDSYRAPENTLEAARLGHRAGADGWELDVRLTRDGVPIVLHDASLLRTTDVAIRFAGDPRERSGFLAVDFDLDEIRRLDAGGWFLEPAGGHRSASAFGSSDRISDADRVRYGSGLVRVPTLAEALTLTRELDWLVNVEIKADLVDGPALVDAALREVIAAGVEGRTLVSSFDHDLVARARRDCPEVATGVLTVHPLHRPDRYAREVVGADAYHPSLGALASADGGGLRRETLRHLRAAGVAAFVYTVNDVGPGGMADRLAEAGASGVFTDDPSTLAARWRGGAWPGR